MAFLQVYNKIGKLRMISVGNSLGLNQNPRIGNDTTQTLMITLDPTLVVSGAGVPSDFGATTYGGTTRDWRLSGSWANLSVDTSFVPAGSTIDFARLVVQTNYGSAPQPTLAQCQVATVTFKVPGGQEFILSPTTTDNSGFNKVANSYDVTTILNGLIDSGNDRALGDYSVSKFPISIQCNSTGGSGGACYIGAGWGLIIYYTHPNMIFNSETLYVGDLPNDTTQTISGFYTPDVGTVQCRVYTQASLSSTIENDTLRFNTVGSTNKFLSGPNNPYNPPWPRNNFLGCAICDYLGGIQYKSSFGNNNASPASGQAGTGVKTEFTVASVQANGYLDNSSRTASIFSTGDISSLGAFGVEIQVNQAYFSTTKYSNKKIYNPGETILYTIPFTNTGGSTASNVVFTDTLPSSLTFVPGSFKVNGSIQPGYTLNNATLPNVRALGTVTVTFDAVIDNAITQITTIPNTAWVGYSFISDPLLASQRDANTTSENIVTVFKSNVTANKIVDKQFADKGDTLNYTIVINNPDFTTYTTVLFQDTIPNGTSFISNSLAINGTTITSNPNTSVNIGSLSPSNSVTLSFKVAINNTIPSPNPVINNGTINYIFTDAFGNTVANGIATNSVSTMVNAGSIGYANKTVNTQFAGIGDTLTYTILLTNNGNVSSTNIVFIDTIPTDTTFISDSVYVNGNNILGVTPAPPTGISISEIGVGKTATIAFNVIVNTIPSPNPIVNNSTTTYQYKSDPNGSNNGSGSINSNSTSTFINIATFSSSLTKLCDKNYATVGSILTYSLVMKNTGSVTANNVFIIDTIPNGTDFISNTIKLNNVPSTGTILPPTGFTIGTIPVGLTFTLTFNVSVNTIPSPNPMINKAQLFYNYTANPAFINDKSSTNVTNATSTTVAFADLSGSKKAVDKKFADCGDTITYTVVIPNSGNVTALNCILKDTIPNGTILVQDSIYVNNEQRLNSNITTGITLPNIGVGEAVTVTYSVKITCQ